MEKVIKALFNEGESTVYLRKRMSRCDYGQILQVEGLTLPDGNIEVDFSLTECEGEASTFIGQVKDNIITIKIPDFIFQKENTYNLSTYDAYAFIYQTDEDSGRTIKKIVFTIQARPKKTTNVPEDQKDQFLEEVRQIMAETKDIAQSVRDDADAGKFDGEQGPKGDAGSIKFIIASTGRLPTEDIDTSAIYLVPLSGVGFEQNDYVEYIYVDGHWEYIGSASVEVNLEDYVKNTDYAFNKVGLVKVQNVSSGLQVNPNTGDISIATPSNSVIDEKSNNYRPITPSNLDYAVKKALSDCKLTGDNVWTDEEKAKALELLGGVDKKYVDDLVGSVESILTELHTYAESLIGGEA